MKRTESLLLMCVMGTVGTYAWAGSGREDSVERLQARISDPVSRYPIWTTSFCQ
jgi:hypothetical protein